MIPPPNRLFADLEVLKNNNNLKQTSKFAKSEFGGNIKNGKENKRTETGF